MLCYNKIDENIQRSKNKMKLKILGKEGRSLYEIIKKDIKINKGVLYTRISRHN